MKKGTTRRTLAEIKAEFLGKVAQYDASENVAERSTLKGEIDKLVEEYNEASRYNSYVDCLNSDTPMLNFIKAYDYPVISATTKKGDIKLKVKDDGKAVHDLWDFVEFCEGANKSVTAALDWKSRATDARDTLLAQVKEFVEEGTDVKPGDFKVALQEAFDSVVFVAGAKGKNAVIATSKNVRLFLITCSRIDYKNFKAQFAGEQTWKKHFFAFLNCAVANKTFDIIYGDNDSVAVESEAEAEAEAQEAPKAETKTKSEKSK